jgi:hypothetical protein
MRLITEVDREVARLVLDDVLRREDVEIDGHSLRQIFEEIAASPGSGRGMWRHLAERLGYDDPNGVKRLVRERLPEVLRRRPELLRALADAAGMDVTCIRKEARVPYTQTEDRRMTELLRQFEQEFHQAMVELEPGEIALEITGSPHSIALASLVTRYFHGRLKTLVLFAQLPQEPVAGLDQYLEEYRLYYGLDPLVIQTPETVAAFTSEGAEGFWQEAARLLKGRDGVRTVVCAVARKDPAVNVAEFYTEAGIKVASLLDEWTVDDVYTYLDQNQLQALDTFTVQLFAEREEKAKTEDRKRYRQLAKEYTVDGEGRYVRNGVVISEKLLPEGLCEEIHALVDAKAAKEAKKTARKDTDEETDGGGESAGEGAGADEDGGGTE